MAFILFRIIYIMLAASKIGESKPSCQHCLEDGKQNAALKILKFVLDGRTEHDVKLVTIFKYDNIDFPTKTNRLSPISLYTIFEGQPFCCSSKIIKYFMIH